MPIKRLENALNASKLIGLGFSLNNANREHLKKIYNVDCTNYSIEFFNDDYQNNRKWNKKCEKNYNDNNDLDSDDSNTSNELKNEKFIKDDAENDEKIEILCLKFNENSNLIASGDSNGHVQIFDIFSGQKVTANDLKFKSDSNINKIFSDKKVSNSILNNMPTICIKWHPYSNGSLNLLFFANVNGLIGVLDRESLEKRTIIEEADEIACIDFNLDGTCMASVGKDFHIRLYDTNLNNSSNINKILKIYGSECESLPLYSSTKTHSMFENITRSLSTNLSVSSSSLSSSKCHSNRLQCVKFSDTSNDLLFTGGWDRTVKIWDKRTSKGYVNTINGPFICGSDAIDVKDNLILTASWVKENALELWDMRDCTKRISSLQIISDISESKFSNNEYLYACKFFSTNNRFYGINQENEKQSSPPETQNNFTTVLACGSGTQSLHLIDYEKAPNKQHLASMNCQSHLYCMDSIYSYSLIACGGIKKFFTMMASNSLTN